MIKPNARFDKVTDIKVDFLKKHNIEGVILDVDNTLIDVDGNVLEGLKNWIKMLHDNNIKICVATNSNKKQRVKRLCDSLDIPFVLLSLKPLKFGIKRALRILGMEKGDVAEIGDQLFTDVWVSNRMKLFSILTNPLMPEKSGFNKLKRKIEQKLLKNFTQDE